MDEMNLGDDTSLPMLVKTDDCLFDLPQWTIHTLVSNEPLAGEDRDDFTPKPPYEYRIIVVLSEARMILLASRRKMVDCVINRVFHRKMFPNLEKVDIRLDQLIRDCSRLDGVYRVTALNGNSASGDRSLRTISLYGDDVTRSVVYRNSGELFNFFSCGVGRRLEGDLPRIDHFNHGEVARLGNDGFVMATIGNREKAVDFLKVIGYVIANRWVDNWAL